MALWVTTLGARAYYPELSLCDPPKGRGELTPQRFPPDLYTCAVDVPSLLLIHNNKSIKLIVLSI